jgi:hypothetical protein
MGLVDKSKEGCIQSCLQQDNYWMHGYLNLAFEHTNSLYISVIQVFLEVLFHYTVDITDKFL